MVSFPEHNASANGSPSSWSSSPSKDSSLAPKVSSTKLPKGVSQSPSSSRPTLDEQSPPLPKSPASPHPIVSPPRPKNTLAATTIKEIIPQPLPPKASLPPSTQNSPPWVRKPSPDNILPSPPLSSKPDSGPPVAIYVGVIVGAFLLILLFLICVTYIRKKQKKNKNQMQYYADNSHGRKDEMNPASPLMHNRKEKSYCSSARQCSTNPASPNLALGYNKNTFTYDELEAATNGFSKDNLLGQGGFGYVFKGVLANDKLVAVKTLKSGSAQGDCEFQAEVDIISRVHHRHLVSLVGYCIDGEQRILVYEFVPNKTLDFHLHVKGGTTLDWSKRLVIAIGTAKGLAYLHEDCHPRIIHRDIKASNILLDNKYEAMVADFGLAKLTTDSKSHVSTRVMGTYGYLAPEYASSGQLTEKSDVFSYGVMLVELITGQKAVHMGKNLTDWARPILIRVLENNNYEELVDPHLHNEYNHHEMARMITCASASIRESAKRRPKMSQIVRVLEGDVSIEVLNDDPSEAPVVS